jgi:crotonobetainyl-CoA:carnitine CoA-transferase CaiB-like acyl-CoA transferase
MNDARFGVYRDVPRAGQHTREVMREVGYGEKEVEELVGRKVVG